MKSISVTSSAECFDLTKMSVQNQQHIRNMESEIAKLKQQNATLLAQQHQHQQQQLQLQQQQKQQQQLQLQQQLQQQQQRQQTQVVTPVKKHRHCVKNH